jgi:ferric-dicitrate binding protein FerR (iron transport regulator)
VLVFRETVAAVWTHRGLRALACLALLAALGVFPGALRAQFSAGDGAATLLSTVGEVSVLRSASLWALFPNDTVQPGETIITGPDSFAEFRVADGSSFQVYPDSRVVFRKNPGTLRDLLDVFLGRVKVYIQHLGGRPNRHRVFTPTAVISVRGTVFEVSVDDTETTLIAVDEGTVGVSHRLLPNNEEIAVEAGQSLIVYRDAPLAKAGVDKARAVRLMEGLARAAASVWQRSRGPAGSAPSGGAGGGLPGDEPAPEAPPPPSSGTPDAQAPAPPPAP